MSIELSIPLLIIIGIISSFIASLIGLGGGIASVPFIMLIIGDHNLEAKLIGYVSIAFLSIIASFKYYRLKRKPEWSKSFILLIGILPITVISELYVSPILETENMKPYFHLFYSLVVVLAVVLVNIKDKIKLKKPINNILLIPIGSFIGFLSGSFGLSGGVLFIPLLVVGLQISIKEAAVTSLILKLVTSFANIITGASAGQFSNFESNGVYWFLPLIIIIGSFIGSQIGPIVNQKITTKQIQLLFNIIMVIIFSYEVVKSIIGFT